MHLDDLRKKHHGAVHFCYAFQIGTDKIHYRANDDGESIFYAAFDPVTAIREVKLRLGDSFTLGQTISIPKNDLGGSSSGTNDLDITITSLITEKEHIENQLILFSLHCLTNFN